MLGVELITDAAEMIDPAMMHIDSFVTDVALNEGGMGSSNKAHNESGRRGTE
jgi:hypothetical protein